MVSHKANATRKRSNIIVMHNDDQIVFVDTPGIHETEKLLNQFMLDEALKAMGDCDLILFLAPITDKVSHYEDFLVKNKKNVKHILLLTKIDFVSNEEVLAKIKEYEKFADKYETIIPVSIKKATTHADILDVVVKYLPEHPYLFDPEILTTEHLRDIFKEFIRESIFDNISDGTIASDPNALDIVYSNLVWSDEFNGAKLDTDKWHHQTIGIQNGGWANGEFQHYTNNEENSFVEAGNLHIVAKKETIIQNEVSRDFTSARLNSKFAFTYGRVDIRAKLPEGNGTWPALWTLGKNINEIGAYWETKGFGTTSWPACGEIDIMEHGLHATNVVSSALHTPSSFGATINTAIKPLPNVSENFHVYSINWSPNQITFLVDGVGYYTYNPTEKNDTTWPFYLDQFLILNVAIGGFSGNPDANFTTSFKGTNKIARPMARPVMIIGMWGVSYLTPTFSSG